MAQQQLTESTEKTKQQISRRQLNSDAARPHQDRFHSVILQLQRELGNRRVAQLIQMRRITPEGKIIGLQPKLTVGAADVHYEQEADRVARQVVCIPDSVAFASFQNTPQVIREANQPQTLQNQTLPLTASITPFVQRKMGKDGRENGSIQGKSAGSLTDSFEAGDDVESRVNQSKGGGNPLPDSVRAYMEPRFGMDFSQVRVHTGSNAIQMNRDVGAQAFTHGSDIYYGAGKNPSDMELTAHELTHVVQKTGSAPLQMKRPDKEHSSASTTPSIQRTCKACASRGPNLLHSEVEKMELRRQVAHEIQRRMECREDEETQQSICNEVPENTSEEPNHTPADQVSEQPQTQAQVGPPGQTPDNRNRCQECLNACALGGDFFLSFCRSIPDPALRGACFALTFAGEVACAGWCYWHFCD